jgi:hypothetical protein
VVAFEVSITNCGQCGNDPVHAGDQFGLLISCLEAAVIWVTVAIKPSACQVVAVCFARVVGALVLATQEDPEATKNIDTGEHQHQNYNSRGRLIGNRLVKAYFLKQEHQQR